MPTQDDKGAPLDARLKQYHDAIASEFELAKNPTPDNIDKIRENAATQFLMAVPKAVERILYLSEHAEKDTTQLAASKFIVASALTKDGIGEAGDPLLQLLNELKQNDNKKQPKK